MKRLLLVTLALGSGCYTFDAEGTKCDQDSCPAGFQCVADHCTAKDGGQGGGSAGGSSAGGMGGSGGSAPDSGEPDAGQLCDCTKPACNGQTCRFAAGPCDVAEVCSAGACPTDAFRDAGTTCGAVSCQGNGLVPPKTCDSAGNCLTPQAGDCGNYRCRADAGACQTTCRGSYDCANMTYCNDGGVCVAQKNNAIPCAADDQCLSSHCADGYCCNQACTGACDSCDLTVPLRGQCTLQAKGFLGAPACGRFLCDGVDAGCPTTCVTSADCATGSYCNGAQVCAQKQTNGLQCTLTEQCASGNCVDGYCCNSACSAGCDVCNKSGNEGTCTVAALGSPGDAPSCAPYLCPGNDAGCPSSCSFASECAGDAGCTGNQCGGKLGNGQSCAARPASDCLSGICADGVCCGTACDGGLCDRCDLSTPGVCTNNVGATDAGCGAYACGAGPVCPAMCSTDPQCAPGYFCNVTTCASKLGLGSVCGSGNQCASGNCVEGVCCSSSCAGACRSCLMANGAPSNGTCGDVTVATDPKDQCGFALCAAGGVCASSCTGTCPGSCKSGTGQCLNGSCVGLFVDLTACTTSCSCESGICAAFYADRDGDRYGKCDAGTTSFCGTTNPTGYAPLNMSCDCCDDDTLANPAQQSYYGSPRNVCGGFDYNCDGVEERVSTTLGNDACSPSYPNGAGCDAHCTGQPASYTQAGWLMLPAGCGLNGIYTDGTCETYTSYDEPQCPGNMSYDCYAIAPQTTMRCR